MFLGLSQARAKLKHLIFINKSSSNMHYLIKLGSFIALPQTMTRMHQALEIPLMLLQIPFPILFPSLYFPFPLMSFFLRLGKPKLGRRLMKRKMKMITTLRTFEWRLRRVLRRECIAILWESSHDERGVKVLRVVLTLAQRDRTLRVVLALKQRSQVL